MFSRLLKLMVQVVLIFAIAGLIPEVSAQQPVKPSEPAPPSPPSSNSPAAALSQGPYSTANDNEYREDFSDLTLKGSAFFPLRPVLGEKDDNPIMPFTREFWQLMWRPADPIDLYVCKPRAGAGKLPVILYLYTYPSDTNRFKSDDWCMTMTSEGFAAVGFVSAYTGHRREMHPMTTFFTDFQESLASTVHDVQMILDYLATRDDMDMNRVGMYGQGSGGTIAILASTVDKRVRALDVLTPWGDWPNFFSQSRYVAADKRAKFLGPEFQVKIAAFDPLTVMTKVRAKSLRIQDVRKSGPMPDASQERLEAAAPPTAIINQYGDMASMAANAPVGVLFGWLRAELQPSAKPTVTLAKTERVHYFPPENVNPMPPLVPWDELKKQEKEKQKAKEQQAAKDQQAPKDQETPKDKQP